MGVVGMGGVADVWVRGTEAAPIYFLAQHIDQGD